MYVDTSILSLDPGDVIAEPITGDAVAVIEINFDADIIGVLTEGGWYYFTATGVVGRIAPRH